MNAEGQWELLTNVPRFRIPTGQLKIDPNHPPGSERMTELWEPALLALLSSSTVAEAANKIKVPRSTLQKWMRSERFMQDLDTIRKEHLAQSARFLQGASSDAARVLHEIATDSDAPASVRVAAAKEILSLTTAMSERELLAEQAFARLNELRESFKELQAPRSPITRIEETPRMDDTIAQPSASDDPIVSARARSKQNEYDETSGEVVFVVPNSVEETDWIEVSSTEEEIESVFLIKNKNNSEMKLESAPAHTLEGE